MIKCYEKMIGEDYVPLLFDSPHNDLGYININLIKTKPYNLSTLF